MSAPVALVGSGEFLPVMRPVDEYLLEGRPKRAVFLPTASGLEGSERINYWLELGAAHYAALGVEGVPLPVITREDAMREDLASEIAGAGLVYLSGGSPAYLSATLRDTPVWEAILAAYAEGAALAGCSAGACALSAYAGGFRDPSRLGEPGLRVIPHLAVIPHFDRFLARDPNLVTQILDRTDGLELVGVEERTALVGGPEEFTVQGEQKVWVLHRDGTRTGYGPGEDVSFPLPA